MILESIATQSPGYLNCSTAAVSLHYYCIFNDQGPRILPFKNEGVFVSPLNPKLPGHASSALSLAPFTDHRL